MDCDDASVRQYFQSEILPLLGNMQKLRNRRNLCYGAAAAVFVLVFFAPALSGVKFGPIPMIFGIVVGVILFFVGNQLGKSLRQEFKSRVVRPLIALVHKELNYNLDGGISRGEFQSMSLFSGRIDSYKAEDDVAGVVDGVKLRFCEIKATRTEGSGKNRRTVVVFQGAVFKADFNKNFSCRLLVLPDFAEAAFGKLVGNFLQQFSFSQNQLIKLEDPEFEKAFAVYGSDQQEARYILSPSLMKRMLELRSRLGNRIFFSFKDNVMYVAVSRTSNMFEIPAFARLDDFALAHGIVSDLEQMVSIARDMNLETRIWSKQ